MALANLKSANNYREMIPIECPQQPRVRIHGQEFIMLASSSYLGLNTHLELIHAMQLAANEYGVGSGGSRLITGTTRLHTELERVLAEFLCTEDAILFNSGYDANIGVIPTVMQAKDVIFSDELNHASIIDGCQLSKGKLVVYKHNDMIDLEPQLKAAARDHAGTANKYIITDTVFSMGGDLAKLDELTELAERYDAHVMVDEAHAVGVFGANGRGVAEAQNVEKKIDIKMGALSKALGSQGGFIAGSHELVDYLRNRARSFIYTTSLPPPVLASGLAAIKLVRTGSGLRKRLWSNIRTFTKGLTELGYDTMSSASQIVPILIGDAARTMSVSNYLFEHGVFVTGIRPPTVPPGKCRLRTTMMANHRGIDLKDALSVFEAIKNKGIMK